MVQRLTYRKRHSYATKSNQHRIVKTPGNFDYNCLVVFFFFLFCLSDGDSIPFLCFLCLIDCKIDSSSLFFIFL